MVVNSNSGDVTSLHSYFNKHLMSVQQLSSILGSVSRQIGAAPQVDQMLCSWAILSFITRCIHTVIRSKLERTMGRRRRGTRKFKFRMMKQPAFVPYLIDQGVEL